MGRGAAAQVGDRGCDRGARGLVVPAIEPQRACGGKQASQRSVRQPLHSCGPVRASRRRLDGGGGNDKLRLVAQHRDRERQVAGLVWARQAGKRGIERPARVAIMEARSEEHTSELQSLMRISYAVFCLKKKKKHSRDK